MAKELNIYSTNKSQLDRVIKRFPSFIMGKCRCGYCDLDIPIRRGDGYLQKFALNHRKGKSHPRYKGVINAHHGYKRIKIPFHPNASKNGYIYYHIYLMTCHIHRPLEKGEVVHHRDGNTSNNSIDNLKLFSNNGEHRRTHRSDYTDRICYLCGKNFTYIDKNGYHRWYRNEIDEYICSKCNTMIYNKSKRK